MNKTKESKFIVAVSFYFFCDHVLTHNNSYSFVSTNDLYNDNSIILFDSKNEADYYMQKRFGLDEGCYHVFTMKCYYNYRKSTDANRR